MKEIIIAISGLFVPLIVAWISSRHHFRRDPFQEFSTAVESAKEFKEILNSNESQIIKDRIAQKFCMSKYINFQEAEYFSKYIDMEKWINKYISVRKEIKLIYSKMGVVEGLATKNSKKVALGYLVLYFVTAAVALSPFFKFKWYISIGEKALLENNYILIFNMITWPLLFAIGAFFFLVKTYSITDAHRFLKELDSEGLRIEKQVEQQIEEAA